MKPLLCLISLLYFCLISTHAQVADTAKVMTWKIEKPHCLFSYLKRGFITQQELASIDADVSSYDNDTGRIVSFSLTIQRNPFVQEFQNAGGFVDIWPDLIKLPKEAIIYINDIVYLKKDGTTSYWQPKKIIVQ